MPSDNSNDKPHLQEINEEIYKHSLELAIVNKNLSLLRKLYQITLLSLDPSSLSEKISETVRVDLNMELVGMFVWDEKEDSLKPLYFAESDRFHDSASKLGMALIKHEMKNVFKKANIKQVIHDKKELMLKDLKEFWVDSALVHDMEKLDADSHIETILVYPLVTQEKTIGALLLGLNRDYKALNEHEKESIKSLINVVAVALEKVQSYGQLKATNEQLKVLDLARSEFITIASHQLRTPPSSIKWYLAAILAGDYGPISEDVKTQLTKTQTTNNSLIVLIDDLLNVSRIERGKLEFMFQTTDMLAITQLTVDQLQPQATSKGLELIFEKRKEAIPHIIADTEKVRQVINNLIDNAIKYTKTGKVVVELGKTSTDVFVKVKDSGKGVVAEQKESIFDKFDRGKAAVNKSTGLGLGLYVSKVIIEQHNGKIWVESDGEGKGSTFIFSLPILNTLTETTFDLTKNQ